MHSFLGARALPVVRAIGASFLIAISGLVLADDAKPNVRADAPNRYVVVEGDTLWGVAERFLDDPWRWPEIWRASTGIDDPNLIYPGDVVVLGDDGMVRVLRQNKLAARVTTAGGAGASAEARVVKVLPKIYSEALEQAIPVISPRAIVPFLTEPLVVQEDGLEQFGYVVAGVKDSVILGKYQEFFARGVTPSDAEIYQIFRPGRPFIDPDTAEELGQEAVYVGDARLIEFGETSRFEITSSRFEISPEDRLMPAPKNQSLPYYFPRAPESELRGKIINALEGVSELGRYAVVVVNLGERDGIEAGHVLRVFRHRGVLRDPVTLAEFVPPEISSGLLMVFRSFEKVSYALVMKSSQAIHINDAVATP